MIPVPDLLHPRARLGLDDERSTYQFVPGVAPTSLAAATARRLGVNREELSRLLYGRGGSSRP